MQIFFCFKIRIVGSFYCSVSHFGFRIETNKTQNILMRRKAVETRSVWCRPAWALAALCVLFLATTGAENIDIPFELEENREKVECVQCVQLWRSAGSGKTGNAKPCGPNAPTCWGDACFMRQCKHCPVYQYMSGCVNLTPWQMADLQAARRISELRMRRVGSVLLCEDSFNQTTCLCNRRDKCNTIHSQSRVPFSTYAEGLFTGIINFDHVIGKIDPRYLEVISGYNYRFLQSSSIHSQLSIFFVSSLIYRLIL